jgi:hypothetical protein
MNDGIDELGDAISKEINDDKSSNRNMIKNVKHLMKNSYANIAVKNALEDASYLYENNK